MSTPTTEIARLNQYNTSTSNVSYTFIGPTGFGYVTNLVQAFKDVSVVSNWIAGLTATLVVSPDSTVAEIVALTQSQYNAISSPSPTTLYVILDS